MIDLNDIPQDKTDNLPTGVTEQTYGTEAEINAFVDGVTFPDDIDVEVSTPFQRGDQWVVRVCVGDWNDDTDEESE